MPASIAATASRDKRSGDVHAGDLAGEMLVQGTNADAHWLLPPRSVTREYSAAAEPHQTEAAGRAGRRQTRRMLGCDGSLSAKFTGPMPQMAMMAGSGWPRTTPS